MLRRQRGGVRPATPSRARWTPRPRGPDGRAVVRPGGPARRRGRASGVARLPLDQAARRRPRRGLRRGDRPGRPGPRPGPAADPRRAAPPRRAGRRARSCSTSSPTTRPRSRSTNASASPTPRRHPRDVRAPAPDDPAVMALRRRRASCAVPQPVLGHRPLRRPGRHPDTAAGRRRRRAARSPGRCPAAAGWSPPSAVPTTPWPPSGGVRRPARAFPPAASSTAAARPARLRPLAGAGQARGTPGDEVVLTRLDHDADVRPWVQAAQARQVRVRWIDVDPATADLDPASLDEAVTERTRLVAVTGASNLLGTRPRRLRRRCPRTRRGRPWSASTASTSPPTRWSTWRPGRRPVRLLALQVPRRRTAASCGADPALLETLHPDKLAARHRRRPRALRARHRSPTS